MTFKEFNKQIVKTKITNITPDSFKEEDLEDILDEWDEHIFKGNDYIFSIYEGMLHEIPEMDLVLITGHEQALIFNTKTKIFKEVDTR